MSQDWRTMLLLFDTFMILLIWVGLIIKESME